MVLGRYNDMVGGGVECTRRSEAAGKALARLLGRGFGRASDVIEKTQPNVKTDAGDISSGRGGERGRIIGADLKQSKESFG